MDRPTLFGHPTGLFNLFFSEMWERFSYYGMRALLVFYMLKGFLGYGDKESYAVYGAYTALVYMTPFFGGMLSDRVLGARRAVLLGGLLMAAGHLTMTIESKEAFYLALGLLIVGNGFFKPNISTIVGSLYPDGSTKRDAGFTLFYMGINLGAAMAPLLCGYVGETYGWHYGFGLATVGMLIGLAVFAVPTRVAQFLILGGALATGGSMFFLADDAILTAINSFVALALIASAFIAFAALNKGGIPGEAGQPPVTAPKSILGLPTLPAVIGGTLLLVPVLAWLVNSARSVRLVPEDLINSLSGQGAVMAVAASFLQEIATPPGLVLFASGAVALYTILSNAWKAEIVERQRLYVVVVMMFFSMLFWAFFEQAGSSINNFTDRNVDRVREERLVAADEVGKSARLLLTQEQVGRIHPAANVGQAIEFDLTSEQVEGILRSAGATMPVPELPAAVEPAVGGEAAEVAAAPVAPAAAVPVAVAEVAASLKLALTPEQVGGVLASGEAAISLTPEQVGGLVTAAGAVRATEAAPAIKLELTQEQRGRIVAPVASALYVNGAAVGLDWLDDPAVPDEAGKEAADDKLQVVAGGSWTPGVISLTHLDAARKGARELAEKANKAGGAVEPKVEVDWNVAAGDIGMGVGGSEIPASTFQAANPIFILLFGLGFTALWGFLGARRIEPNTAVKFSLGLIQLGLGFGVLWYGAGQADSRGMVNMSWLILGYLLHTTGELCLSPVGLSMVARLSPGRLVSTVMGAWFLATAFSSLLAGIIASFTGVGHGGGDGRTVPLPSETLGVYSAVFGQIGVACLISAGVLLAMSPMLVRWMHETGDEPKSAGH